MAERRGPKRSEAVRRAILQATAAEVAAHGYDGLRIEAIAARAGAGKQTVYRWWPSKGAIIAECIAEGVIPSLSYAPADTGDLAVDLTRWVDEALTLIADDANHGLMRGMLAAALDSPATAPAAMAGPEVDVRERLRAGQHAGQLARDADTDTLSNAIIGCLVLRILQPAAYDPGEALRIVGTLLPESRRAR